MPVRYNVRRIFLLLVCAAVLCTVLYAPRIIASITQYALIKTLAVSKVSIGACDVAWGEIRYKDIVISGGAIDRITVPVLTVRFSLRSLYAFTASDVFVDQAAVVLQSGTIRAQGVSCRFDPLTQKGNLRVSQCTLGKVDLTDCRGDFYLDSGNVILHDAETRVLGGKAYVRALFALERIISYSVRGEVAGISLQDVERAFELSEKVHLEGALSGTFIVDGIGQRIVGLTGDIKSLQPGGVIALHDDTMIKNIAAASKQPVEIIAEGFRDYRYAFATVTMRTETMNIIVHVLTSGSAGKRDLTIMLHGDSPGKVGL